MATLTDQLYPEVIDATTLGASFAPPIFLPIAIEGQAASGAAAVVGQAYSIEKPSDATGLFGSSTLTTLVNFVLSRGVSPVIAVASVKGSYADEPTERAAAWANIVSNGAARIVLTDSTTQARLVALADAMEDASLIQNKMFTVVGMPTGTSKAALITAAGAIQSTRAVLVGPGVYDENGTLRSGAFAAAQVAAAVALNPDIVDDLDTLGLPNLTGIEKDSFGLPMFRKRVAASVVTNDFEDLLTGGVSPLQQSPEGGVEITHLRMTYTTDETYDSLQTRLIADQIFLDVKAYAEDNLFLRRGNTEVTREALRSGVEALLQERSNWITTVTQADGEQGYNVEVSSSLDERQVTVSYEGNVVRGISTILVAGKLNINV